MDFEWLRLNEGTTQIRILADLGNNVFHWVRRETARGAGFDRHPCPGEGCSLCEDEDLHPSARRMEQKLYAVIDRNDGRVKFFSAGGAIQRELEHAVKAAPFHKKNLSRFDVFITKEGRRPFYRYGVAVDHPRRLRVAEQEEALQLLSEMIARLRPNCRL